MLADPGGTHLQGEAGTVAMSGREQLWPFYYHEFTLSPVVGRGIGAGFIAAADWLPGLTAPHDEYLHYLVIGGVVGFVLIVGGIGLWYRHLLQIASLNDRPCLLALIPAVAVYVYHRQLVLLRHGAAAVRLSERASHPPCLGAGAVGAAVGRAAGEPGARGRGPDPRGPGAHARQQRGARAGHQPA